MTDPTKELPEDDAVRLSFRSTSRHLRLCRTAAVSLGSDLDLDVDALDDLRLAVGEAVAWLRDGVAPTAVVDVELGVEEGVLRVRGSAPHGDGEPEPDELVRAILGATVDDFDLGCVDGVRRVSLEKRRHDG